METHGSRIRRLRIAKGWDSYRAADKATDIPAGTWQNMEARGTQPTIDTAQKIAAAFGQTIDELLSGTVYGPAGPAQDDEPPPDTGSAPRPRRPRGGP